MREGKWLTQFLLTMLLWFFPNFSLNKSLLWRNFSIGIFNSPNARLFLWRFQYFCFRNKRDDLSNRLIHLIDQKSKGWINPTVKIKKYRIFSTTLGNMNLMLGFFLWILLLILIHVLILYWIKVNLFRAYLNYIKGLMTCKTKID